MKNSLATFQSIKRSIRNFTQLNTYKFLGWKQMDAANPYFYSEDTNAIYDIYVLFKYYNQFFFNGILQKCTLEWSKKMTLCAGTCENKGFGSCSIKLSQPLLKFRTPNELKQTILHEMIHAFLFITNPRACLTEGGHGKEFKQIMHNINSITNLRVTVYHSFTDEVESYRTHVWRCNGICKQQPPFFGYVKRSMNRKPQLADSWWKEHQRYCGGQFIKISEPQNSKKPILKNGKSLKTNSTLSNKGSQYFVGKGKTLEDYAKEMTKNPIKKTKSNKFEEQKQQENCEKEQIFTQNDIYQKKPKATKNEPQQKTKTKSKAIKDERESHKITDWFQKQGKTIEQYSKQIEQERIMNSMSFN